MDCSFISIDSDGKISFKLSNSKVEGIDLITQIFISRLKSSSRSSIFTDLGGDIDNLVSGNIDLTSIYADVVIRVKEIVSDILSEQMQNPDLNPDSCLKSVTPLGYTRNNRSYKFLFLIKNQNGVTAKASI